MPWCWRRRRLEEEGPLVVDMPIGPRLLAMAQALRELRDHRAPAVAMSAWFEAGAVSSRVPFDGVSCPTSRHIQFVARDASKPGRPRVGIDGRELWTAVSTIGYGRELLNGVAEDDTKTVAVEMERRLANLFAPFFGGDALSVPAAARVTIELWREAFVTKSLGLKEDCISLEPCRLAVCGDFLRDYPSPAEAAAVSGMEAGERLASWFAGAGPE